jgi:anthranilate synthase component I
MRRYFPDFAAFSESAKAADIVPVYRQLLGDRLTPVSAFQVLGRDPHAFLLESVVGGEKIGRYSFIATAPSLVYQVTEGNATISAAGGFRGIDLPRQFRTTDPLADLQKLLPPRRYHQDRHLPAFTGGLVGYAGYDAARYYESEKLQKAPKDDRRLPDMLFGLYGELVIFDHVDKTIKVVSNADLTTHPKTEDAYREACRRIDDIVTRLQQPPMLSLGEIDASSPLELKFESNFSREAFENAVRKGQEYIRAGDIFQFVPSQRLRVPSSADPFDVYRALRIINPSPFMFYLKSPQSTLIGSSPEILCRVADNKVTSRPLAGTRRRGNTPEEDRLLEAELLADPKERAEHIMLVDLSRNDLGRVCQYGTVRVNELMIIERYSHVMHIVSDVTGTLRGDKDVFDVLRACFPHGTVSGAPKVRAMEIIDEQEPTRRGFYAGSVGYFSYSGDMDMAIAIRTMLVDGGTAYLQAGGGLVADSVPANEYQECVNKARALVSAIELAEAGLE